MRCLYGIIVSFGGETQCIAPVLIDQFSIFSFQFSIFNFQFVNAVMLVVVANTLIIKTLC